uniref:Phospholipase/carboxylesterase/thioesterase domain-containing protein n=1 Tax=Quercus lobata TaxID=97700 RepID=A0A7N2KU12_QUELO
MSNTSSSIGSVSGTATRTFEFGRTHVVRPKGRHQATIVWLHGLGDKGSSWSQLLETLPLSNIKWICPTAPTRPVRLFGGFPCTAWFDVGDFSEDAPDDLEGLDASAAHVANLLSTEPADIDWKNKESEVWENYVKNSFTFSPYSGQNSYLICDNLREGRCAITNLSVKLGVGGFSMGAATALYSAICLVSGNYGNGNLYPVNLSAIVGLSGWLPCSRNLRNRMEGSHEAARRAASLPIFLCHGLGDEVVAYEHGKRSAENLSSAGFRNLTFRTYNGLGHYTIPEETDEVCNWLTATLGLDGSQSY